MQQDCPTLPTHLQPQIISGCVASFSKDFLEASLVNKVTQNVALLLLQVLSLFVYYGYCIPHNNEKLCAPVCWFTTQSVWLQIVWITVDYWNSIQMCMLLIMGIPTKADYLFCYHFQHI